MKYELKRVGIFSVIKISQENLFGRGQSLSLSAMIGGESNKFDIGL